jgi:hypothetical protein
MISKETFVDTMHRLDVLDEKISRVDDALRDLSQYNIGLYIPETMDIVMDLLKEMLQDKYDFLEYCVYERDFLRDLEPDDVRDENGNCIDLTSWDKVYDFLVDSMEE